MSEDTRQYTLNEVIDKHVKNYKLQNGVESKIKNISPSSTILCGRCGFSMRNYGVTESRTLNKGGDEKRLKEYQYKCTNSRCGEDIDKKTSEPSVKVITKYNLNIFEDEKGHETEELDKLESFIVRRGSGPEPTVASNREFKKE